MGRQARAAKRRKEIHGSDDKGPLPKGKEEELEVGQPGNEESRCAAKMQSMESERKEQEESDDWDDSEEPGCAIGDDLGHGITVGKRDEG
ncbi:hypothetical protein PVL29_012521 [Vitis rotundifolia]|uniref:Uncharacterized protein n=1 Tax=Vitis rotundifolia TaxID=103349 RepID=A0AA38ZK53_VITRO|nr:hypothetical protein PVL29_012521 [Vitis rotundifolia]